MTILGVIGILLSFAGLFFASARPSQSRAIFAIALTLLHIGASIAYYSYAQSNPSDAFLYYYDAFLMRKQEFELGTVFVIKFVQFLKALFGGTFLDYFLLFQVLGIWGILLLFRTFQEIHDHLGQRSSQLSYVLLLFPGLHFWTSALGKDGPVFFAVSLAVWAAIKLRSRIVGFVVAIGIMILIRPHVALMATIALAVAAFFDNRANRLAKTALFVIAIAGASYISLTVKSTFSVDVTNADSISDFLANQQQSAQTQIGGTMVRDASFFVKLVSLLFRPMFFDANGIFALVASVENLFTVFLFGFMLWNWKELWLLARRVFFLRFALILAIALILLLTLLYYNVGLGLRQKAMIYPAFFAFVVSQWAFDRAQRWTKRQAANVRQAPFNSHLSASLAPRR
jgi:hypothetical protein